jgi:hypothetical protein
MLFVNVENLSHRSYRYVDTHTSASYEMKYIVYLSDTYKTKRLNNTQDKFYSHTNKKHLKVNAIEKHDKCIFLPDVIILLTYTCNLKYLIFERVH